MEHKVSIADALSALINSAINNGDRMDGILAGLRGALPEELNKVPMGSQGVMGQLEILGQKMLRHQCQIEELDSLIRSRGDGPRMPSMAGIAQQAPRLY